MKGKVEIARTRYSRSESIDLHVTTRCSRVLCDDEHGTTRHEQALITYATATWSS